MQFQEPFTVTLEADPLHCWDDESTASALRTLAVRLQSTGISLRKTAAALEEFGPVPKSYRVRLWFSSCQGRYAEPPFLSKCEIITVLNSDVKAAVDKFN